MTLIEDDCSVGANERAMQTAIKTDAFKFVTLRIRNLPDAQLRVAQAKRTFQGFSFMFIEAQETELHLSSNSFLASASPDVNITQPPISVPPIGHGSPTTIPASNAFVAVLHNDSPADLL